jgi:hypothetical protein
LVQHDERRAAMASVRGTRFRRVERLYYGYIRSQRDAVQTMLHRLMTPVAPADEPETN